MGEGTDTRATIQFRRRLLMEFHGATIASDAVHLTDNQPGTLDAV